MIELRAVDEKNVWEILKLSVAENQKDFVATNTESIVEAYTTIISGGVALPFGIYDDDTPVGFVMIGYSKDVSNKMPSVKGSVYSIWRFMIDEKHQGKGLGKKAFRAALDFIRTFPAGEANHCYLSYEPENKAAAKMYHDFAFYETGDTDEDEIIAICKL